jgi:NAD-dependent deacetylase
MKHLVVLSGAGISAESGLKTFRDSGGLWEGHDVLEVASPEGWANNPALVLEFYNQRRKQALSAQPNRAHQIIAELEEHFEVTVITQNVDNLHEKAGSSRVIHLHGELFKARSTADPGLHYDVKGWELNLGHLCEQGSQLRPDVVWFGEAVPLMEQAIEVTLRAHAFVVVGTSLQVYPAAGLLEYVPARAPKYIVDPVLPRVPGPENLVLIAEKATTGMEKVRGMLFERFRLPGITGKPGEPVAS